ncbi:MAG: hypothetical protein AAF603_06210 [Pseudomonadota bacterium]
MAGIVQRAIGVAADVRLGKDIPRGVIGDALRVTALAARLTTDIIADEAV